MYLDSIYRVHLEWMFENQPSLVRDLLRKGKLKDHLDDKEQEGLRVVSELQDEGLASHEAFNVAIFRVLAPPDGPSMSDDPPKPMPYPERQAVWKHLEALAKDEEN